MAEKQNSNDALSVWNGVHGLPDFSAFTDEDFAPAFKDALVAAEAEMDALVAAPAAPTIENFLIPFETVAKALDRVCAVFFMRAGAYSNETIRTLEREFAPALARFSSRLMMDERLFAKIDALYNSLETIKPDAETRRVIEESWKGFVRNGAKLNAAGKKRLAEINERLAVLGATFGQNVLSDEAEWVLYLREKEELAGLPADLRDAMREAARERGQKDACAVTLARAIIEPFLTYSARRDLRETAFAAWSKRGENGGAHDNRAVIAETVRLRDEKARLLGFASFAAFKLDNTMAKTPDHVMDLLMPVWQRARKKAAEELAGLQRLAATSGSNEEITAADWRYYAEKVRAERYNFDAAELKPYLQLDRMIEAAFWVAGRLFGLTFEEQKGVPLWHEDARLWQVKNADGSLRGLFIGDYFARSGKRSGAWMSALQSRHKIGKGQIPVIYNVTNFARAGGGQPALLSLDDARTLFHEFGHALHGLLSDVTWPSISGTSVVRDFVELPSQLYEHWLTVPEVMQKFARHYKTGAVIPQALLKKVLDAQTFNAGFETVEYTSSALVDMAFHQGGAVEDPAQFEKDTLRKLGQPAAITMRHRPCHFTHVFSGDGYSAGYYSYMWSEVLDADAFAAFEESGDVFNPQLAERLRRYIYSAGGSADPADLYKAFRGRLPSPDAMMKKRGLEK